jgi:hypothetical protein
VRSLKLLSNMYTLLVLVVLSACAKQAPIIPQVVKRELLSVPDYARLYNIPFAPDAAPYTLGVSSNNGTMVLEYETKLAPEALIALYKTEMDYWGWRQAGVTSGRKSCLVYQNPSKYCIITVSPVTTVINLVTLYIGPNI